MTEAELGALMLASARAEKHRPGLPKNPAKNHGPSAAIRRLGCHARHRQAVERRAKVLELVQRGAGQRAIAAALNVTRDTVRKDLRALEKEGHLALD